MFQRGRGHVSGRASVASSGCGTQSARRRLIKDGDTVMQKPPFRVSDVLA
jgi:hypothetical protein